MPRPKKEVQAEAPVVAYVEGDEVEQVTEEPVKVELPVDFNLLQNAVKEQNIAKMKEMVLKAVPAPTDELVLVYMDSVANATFAAHAGQTVQQIIQRLKAL